MKKLSGIIAAPFTPFHNSSEINYEIIDLIAELLVKNKVGGAFICGTTGEAPSLTHNEKIRIFERWGTTKKEDLTVIAMLGGTCIQEMKELAHVAIENKLDAISILAPFYFKPDLDQLIQVCAEVAACAADIPFYYYHIPSLTGAFFPMRQFLEKAEKSIPNLAGIKYTHSDLMDFNLCKMYQDGQYTMLWGSDEVLLSGLVAGADGAVGSTYNYAAPLYHEILKNFSQDNIEEAAALQRLSAKMVQILIKYGGSRAGKGFMKLIGVDCGPCRLPLSSLSGPAVEMMKIELEQMNFFEFCSRL